MLAGIPIIASNFPFWQEIVRKYDCGVLVNPENASEIASVAKYLLTHQDEAKQMGQNGRNAVLSYFNWEQEQQKLINFYQ
jgi:glycosyltransferase involved in cell wall biosynthesis